MTTRDVATMVVDAIWRVVPNDLDFNLIVDIVEEEIRVQQIMNGGQPFAVDPKDMPGESHGS